MRFFLFILLFVFCLSAQAQVREVVRPARKVKDSEDRLQFRVGFGGGLNLNLPIGFGDIPTNAYQRYSLDGNVQLGKKSGTGEGWMVIFSVISRNTGLKVGPDIITDADGRAIGRGYLVEDYDYISYCLAYRGLFSHGFFFEAGLGLNTINRAEAVITDTEGNNLVDPINVTEEANPINNLLSFGFYFGYEFNLKEFLLIDLKGGAEMMEINDDQSFLIFETRAGLVLQL